MEIKVKTYSLIKQRLDVNESNFKKVLLEFIDNMENLHFFNKDLYEKLLSKGVNKDELDAMVKELELYSSYDTNPEEIEFPYENWIDRLMTVYVNSADIKNEQI